MPVLSLASKVRQKERPEEIEAEAESVLNAVRHEIFIDTNDSLMFLPIYG